MRLCIELLTIALAALIASGAWYVYEAVQSDLADRKVQGECIASYINAGVERRDIFLVGSTDCEVKK